MSQKTVIYCWNTNGGAPTNKEVYYAITSQVCGSD